jgi:hypothetical protein
MTVRQTLASLGLYAAPPPGARSKYDSREAAVRAKRQLERVAREVRQTEARARAAGEDIPVRKRGRPRMYTPEDAAAVKRLQNAEARRRFQERLQSALNRLEETMTKTTA